MACGCACISYWGHYCISQSVFSSSLILISFFPLRCSLSLPLSPSLSLWPPCLFLPPSLLSFFALSPLSPLSHLPQYYRKPLLALCTTTQPILCERDVNTIFYRIEDLISLHTDLHGKIEAQLQNWSMESQVGDFFLELVSQRTAVEC